MRHKRSSFAGATTTDTQDGGGKRAELPASDATLTAVRMFRPGIKWTVPLAVPSSFASPRHRRTTF
jgi:hypothetical protein